MHYLWTLLAVLVVLAALDAVAPVFGAVLLVVLLLGWSLAVAARTLRAMR